MHTGKIAYLVNLGRANLVSLNDYRLAFDHALAQHGRISFTYSHDGQMQRLQAVCIPHQADVTVSNEQAHRTSAY